MHPGSRVGTRDEEGPAARAWLSAAGHCLLRGGNQSQKIEMLGVSHIIHM
jgi:hypothetical protein